MSLISPIRDTWAESIGLLRERLSRRWLRRVVVVTVIQALALMLVGALVPGVLVEDVLSALLAALAISLLNAFIRPILVVLTLPLSVVTIGLVSLLINTAIFLLAAPLVPGFGFTGFLPAFAAALLVTVVTTVVGVVFSIDQDETFYAELARRLARSGVAEVPPGARGLVVIQIDGLAAPILRNAIRVGLTPRMARWVRSGRYRLVEWECAPPSQTSASQAGLLHGNNDGIPAFRWYEKDAGRLMVSNHPADAAEVERRLSNGRGLLSPGGTSIGNLFSGDAPRSLFTMSRMTGVRGAVDVDAFSLYFIEPAAFIRTAVLTVGEVIKELLESRRQRVQEVEPRIDRRGAFPILRAVSNVVLRDLNVSFLIQAMSRGVPVMYADFVDYDEVAHHAGPERLESLRSLTGVDRVLASLERAAEGAPRDYAFVILSDHGQSQGATFRQRHGQTLEGLVRSLMGGRPETVAATANTESWGPVNALLTELTLRPGSAGRIAGRALRGSTRDGAIDIGPSDARTIEAGSPAREVAAARKGAAPARDDTTPARDERVPGDRPELVVCASGNLANLYLNAHPGRATLEQIEATYPGLVEGLTGHPGIGFVLVRSEARGALALGASGIRYLDDDRVEGDDPLAPFGERTAGHLRRLDGFDAVGDLLVNSAYDPDVEEVAAFEELVGSHGGLGGAQTRPFLLFPADWGLGEGPLVGSPAVHRQLVEWAESLGVGPSTPPPEPEPELAAGPARRPRGLVLVALLLALQGLVWGAAAVLLVAGEVIGELGRGELLVAIVVSALAVGFFLAAIGLIRRWRRAWMATLVVSGLSAISALTALGTNELQGFLVALVPLLLPLLTFYYLTRPHVAAFFGRSTGSRSRAPGRRP